MEPDELDREELPDEPLLEREELPDELLLEREEEPEPELVLRLVVRCDDELPA